MKNSQPGFQLKNVVKKNISHEQEKGTLIGSLSPHY